MKNNEDIVYILHTPGGWYLESPDDQALPDNVPQKSLLRVFRFSDRAELYMDAVSPYVGKMSIIKTTEKEIRSDYWRINNFSRNRFECPAEVVYSSIGYREWPKTLETLISSVGN